MRTILFILILALCAIQCNNDNPEKESKLEPPENDPVLAEREAEAVASDTVELKQVFIFNRPDFFTLIKDGKASYWGYLQGVEKSDSSGPYFMSEYFSDTLSFELFYVPEDLSRRDKISFDSIEVARANDFQGYNCYAFVYPMVDPDKAEDYHADNTPYPVVVYSYYREKGSWKELDAATANDLTELSQIRMRAIYAAKGG